MSELRLVGGRVVLRPLAEADLEPMLRILLEPEIAKWWPDYNAEKLRTDTLDDPSSTTLATASLGQGLGPEALRTLAAYLFSERGHHRLTIDPAAINSRAIAAYRKVGFKPVGVMRCYELGPSGVWRDGLLMDLLKDELT